MQKHGTENVLMRLAETAPSLIESMYQHALECTPTPSNGLPTAYTATRSFNFLFLMYSNYLKERMSVQFLLVQIRPSVHLDNYVRFLVGKAISNIQNLKIYKFEIMKFKILIFPKLKFENVMQILKKKLCKKIRN